jgi:hypothetical protein
MERSGIEATTMQEAARTARAGYHQVDVGEDFGVEQSAVQFATL